MIALTCPHCSKPYEVGESQSGIQFDCTQCGQRLTVPGSAASPITQAPVAAAPLPEAAPGYNSFAGVASGVVVRLYYGNEARKIPTQRTPDEVKKIIRKVLYEYDLDIDPETNEVYGKLDHSWSSLTDAKVFGEFVWRPTKSEYVVDMEYTSKMTGMAIALMIVLILFAWPFVLVGVLLIPNAVKDAFNNRMKDIYYDLERALR